MVSRYLVVAAPPTDSKRQAGERQSTSMHQPNYYASNQEVKREAKFSNAK
jgi:hypothetical protein